MRRGATREGGGPLERLQKPYKTALGILTRLNVPGGTVADHLSPESVSRVLRPLRVLCFYKLDGAEFVF